MFSITRTFRRNYTQYESSIRKLFSLSISHPKSYQIIKVHKSKHVELDTIPPPSKNNNYIQPIWPAKGEHEIIVDYAPTQRKNPNCLELIHCERIFYKLKGCKAEIIRIENNLH